MITTPLSSKLCLIGMLILCACANAAQPHGFLSVSGTKIVNDQGAEVRLRGMNLGWPSYIAYSLSLPGEDNQDRVQAEWLDRFLPPSQAREFFPLLKMAFVKERDFQNIQAMGFNQIRVGFFWRDFDRRISTESEPYYFLDHVILPAAHKYGLARYGFRLDINQSREAVARAIRTEFVPQYLHPWRWTDEQFRAAMLQLDTSVGRDGQGWRQWDEIKEVLQAYARH